jgi:hypothetical protein
MSPTMRDGIEWVLADMRVPSPKLTPGRRAALFVQEINRLRSKAEKAGFLLAPPLKKETLARIFLQAHGAEQGRSLGLRGLGQGAELTGAAGGAMSGATIGAAGGPIGIAIGGIAGAAMGAFAGHGQSAAAAKSASQALKAAKYQKQAAQAVARGQIQSSKALLETEKTKAESRKTIPWWGWAAVIGGGIVIIGIGGFAAYRATRG